MSERPVLVKICGVRTLEAAQAGVDAGADLLGFICYPSARRYLPPERIAAILGNLRRRSSVRAVGVFVNQTVEEMNAITALCSMDLIQLSGDEPAEVIGLVDLPVIKAFRPGAGLFPNCSPNSGGGADGPHPQPLSWAERGDEGPHPTLLSWLERGVDGVRSTVSRRARPLSGAERGLGVRSNLYAALLEPPTAGWGGGGQCLDWSIARALTEQAARPPVFLAGGLRPENVAQAIAAVRPDGVDVSTGVETDGAQDIARIAAFVAAAKGGVT
jgi:phosphoribosylanthranilate isomerase